MLTVSEPSANSELRTENSALAASSTLRLHKPVVYQRGEHGEKHLLAGTYVLLAAETSPPRSASAALHPSETPHVAFQVAAYDASQPLIIDPVLSWATYLGGSGYDGSIGIAVDQAGNAYVTGETTTPGSGFPGTAGSLIQSTLAAATSTCSSRSSTRQARPSSIRPIWAAVAMTKASAIAVDQAGNAYVTGLTDTPGSGFPGTAGSLIQSTFGGGRDAFVTKLNAAGTALVYSTYLGGSGSDEGYGIAVDRAGQAYVTGHTNTPGSGFPGTAGSLDPEHVWRRYRRCLCHEAQRGRHGPRLFDLSGRQRRETSAAVSPWIRPVRPT